MIKKLLFGLFVIFSLVSVLPERTHPGRHSSELEKVTSEDGDISRTDYLYQGELCYATDKHYATLIKTTTYEEKGKVVTESYLDEKGNPAKQTSGHYALIREYDEKNRNFRITYLGDDGEPVITSDGYAVFERTYNELGKVAFERYYDREGQPVEGTNGTYGLYREYDLNSRNYRITYLGADDRPAVNTSGYAVLVRTYNASDLIEYERYYDATGNPAALSSGAYGIYKEYDQNGQMVLTTYLGTGDEPIINRFGYATMKKDGSVETYYDTDGNPIALIYGQYASRNDGGKVVYLDREGKEIFVLSKWLHENPLAVIFFGAALLIVCGKWSKARGVLVALYIVFILYMTLLYRNEGDSRARLELFWSYRQYLTSRSMRLEILYNIWLFVPLGAFLYPNRKLWLAGILLSMGIEAVQYYTGVGLCEWDDVISNGLGTLIGYYLAGARGLSHTKKPPGIPSDSHEKDADTHPPA